MKEGSCIDMALWQIEITMETSDDEYAPSNPNKWDWNELLCSYENEEIIEVKAIQAEKSWSQEYKELNEYVELIIEGEKSG